MVERRGRPPKSIKAGVEKYKKNPSLWLNDVFGIELWKKQEDIINDVWNNRYTAVKSCYGSGKSYLAGGLIEAFVHLKEKPIVISTAPSHRQLDNVWGNVHVFHREMCKFPLGSELLKHEIRCGPKHYALGFTTNVPERIQGIHAPQILIIEDESAGVDPAIHDRLDALMIGEDCHMLSIGNPLSPEGHFYEMFQDPKYVKHTISAFDTPNVQAGKEIIPGLITKTWIDEQRHKYGEDSPWWLSQILGEFPPSGEEMLIPLLWAKMAQERYNEIAPDAEEVYGFDPSAGGMDEAALCTRAGRLVYPFHGWSGLNKPDLVRNVKMHVGLKRPLYVDEVGVGWGIGSDLRSSGVPATQVLVQSNPSESSNFANGRKRFKNLRAELYWKLRERFAPYNENSLGIPPDDDTLLSQLTQIKYFVTDGGEIQIESKKKMRISPNRADALMLTMMDDGFMSAPLSVGALEGQSGVRDAISDFADDGFRYVEWDDYWY